MEFAREGFQTARMAQLTLNASEVPVLDAVLAPGRRDRHRGVRVPLAGGRAVDRDAGGSEDHHGGAAEHAQLHAGALDVVGIGGQRQ